MRWNILLFAPSLPGYGEDALVSREWISTGRPWKFAWPEDSNLRVLYRRVVVVSNAALLSTRGGSRARPHSWVRGDGERGRVRYGPCHGRLLRGPRGPRGAVSTRVVAWLAKNRKGKCSVRRFRHPANFNRLMLSEMGTARRPIVQLLVVR